MKATKIEDKSEDRIQQECVMWFRMTYPDYAKCLYSVPNGGYRNSREVVKLKQTGLTAGVADLHLAVKGEMIFIELKTLKGRQSQAQKEWQELMESQGFEYIVARTLEVFVHKVTEIMSSKMIRGNHTEILKNFKSIDESKIIEA